MSTPMHTLRDAHANSSCSLICRVNCPFYHKIGACRHGDRCGRVHNKPLFSQTVALAHMYQNPMAQVLTTGGKLTPAQEQKIQEEVSVI